MEKLKNAKFLNRIIPVIFWSNFRKYFFYRIICPKQQKSKWRFWSFSRIFWKIVQNFGKFWGYFFFGHFWPFLRFLRFLRFLAKNPKNPFFVKKWVFEKKALFWAFSQKPTFLRIFNIFKKTAFLSFLRSFFGTSKKLNFSRFFRYLVSENKAPKNINF